MAKRICFIPEPNGTPMYRELLIEFRYYGGFAISQKQKSIIELHNNIRCVYEKPDLKILEVSTKSANPIGVALSAFNLMYHNVNTGVEYRIENVFQAAKVFEKGGPYDDLLYMQPKDAKKDERLKSSGKLINFTHNNVTWELIPKTMFYDWIYIQSLYRNKELSNEIPKYDAFTDIEFNHEKSINCQARSAAIYVALYKKGNLDKVISSKDEFRKIYSEEDK